MTDTSLQAGPLETEAPQLRFADEIEPFSDEANALLADHRQEMWNLWYDTAGFFSEFPNGDDT